MIEKVILDFLADVLDVPVLMEMPENRTLPVVLIQKTGSTNWEKVHSVVLAIQSCAASMYEAASLNENVKRAMEDIIALPEITRVELNSDYDFTNYNQSSSKIYRYQAVYQLTHY